MIRTLNSRKKWKAFVNSFFYSAGISTFIILSCKFFSLEYNEILDLFKEYLIVVLKFENSEIFESVSTSLFLLFSMLLLALPFISVLYDDQVKTIKKMEEGRILSGTILLKKSKDFIKYMKDQAKKTVEQIEKNIKEKNKEEIIRLKNELKELKKSKSEDKDLINKIESKIELLKKSVKMSSIYDVKMFLFNEKIPFFKPLETTGLIFLGAAGAGKTNAIFDYINKFIQYDIKNACEHMWIIYDRKHDFWKKLFRAGKDLLFFPDDKRTLKWNWFDEFVIIKLHFFNKETGALEKTYEANDLKEAKKLHEELKDEYIIELEKTVPDSLLNNFCYCIKPPSSVDESSNTWIDKGREGLRAVLVTVSFYYDFPSPKDFIDFCNIYALREEMIARIVELGFAKKYKSINIETIFGDLNGASEASVNTYENFSETARKMVSPNFYYDVDECDFSVRSLKGNMLKSHHDQRIFLVQDPTNEQAFSFIFTAILQLFSKQLLSLPNDLNRRITILCDEAASLGRMDEVFREIPEQGRSKGANLVVGIQSLAAWEMIFKSKAALDAILANLETKVILAERDETTAEYMSKYIGDQEIEYERESMSDDDKGNVAIVRETKRIIKAPDLRNLEPSHAYFIFRARILEVSFPFPGNEAVTDVIPNQLLPFLPSDFADEKSRVMGERKVRVLKAINKLEQTTNKLLTVENIAKIDNIPLKIVTDSIKELQEEQDQVKRALDDQRLKNSELLEGLIPGNIKRKMLIKKLSEKTGIIDLNIIEIIVDQKNRHIFDMINKMKEEKEIQQTIKPVEEPVKIEEAPVIHKEEQVVLQEEEIEEYVKEDEILEEKMPEDLDYSSFGGFQKIEKNPFE